VPSTTQRQATQTKAFEELLDAFDLDHRYASVPIVDPTRPSGWNHAAEARFIMKFPLADTRSRSEPAARAELSARLTSEQYRVTVKSDRATVQRLPR
jgi:hypothetical protein